MTEREPIQEVNIEFGDEVSGMFYEASKLTHANRPDLLEEFHESFSGFRAIPLSGLKDTSNLYMNMALDGAGTKIEVSERLDDHSVIAHDLFAMVCDDAVVRGGEPVAIGSILDLRRLSDSRINRLTIQQLCRGYVEAAKAAGVVIVNGEIAELGDRIQGYGYFNYNWGATALWIAHKERILTGHQIQPGDSLVGLAEHGFRANGMTDVRRAMIERYGLDWHRQTIKELGEVSLGELAQRPSTIYSRFVSQLTGGYDIEKEPKAKVTGVAHITGGGQASKLGRMLEPSGLGATIDEPLSPPKIMLETQRIMRFSDEEAYGKWHMGPGMVIATPEPEKVTAEAANHGITAQKIGKITESPQLYIKNQGAQQSQEWLRFNRP